MEFHIKVSGFIYITSASQKECVSWNARIWTLISSSDFLGDTICLESKFWMSFKTWTDSMWSTNRQRRMFDDTLWLSQARIMTGKWKGGQQQKIKLMKTSCHNFLVCTGIMKAVKSSGSNFSDHVTWVSFRPILSLLLLIWHSFARNIPTLVVPSTKNKYIVSIHIPIP